MNYKRGELITDFKNQVKERDVIYYYNCLRLVTAMGEQLFLSKPEIGGNFEYTKEDRLPYKFGGFYFAIPDCETCPDNKTIDYTCSACQEKQEKKKVKEWLWYIFNHVDICWDIKGFYTDNEMKYKFSSSNYIKIKETEREREG